MLKCERLRRLGGCRRFARLFHGLAPMDYILPPLTRFYMVILPTVGFVRTFGALFTHV